MRVVFDTNILVSAIAIPGGRAESALMRVVSGRDTLLLSRAILLELLDVLARKFSHDSEELSRVALFLAELADLIVPEVEVDILEDEPDNRILECAVAGSAQVIVTGDKAILRLREFEGVRILSLRDHLHSGASTTVRGTF